MNLLIDTNIFIPLEPTSMQEAAAGSDTVAILLQTAQTVKAGLFIHPEIMQDIQRDSDLERQSLHMRAIAKYRQLPAPPHVTTLYSIRWSVRQESELGEPASPWGRTALRLCGFATWRLGGRKAGSRAGRSCHSEGGSSDERAQEDEGSGFCGKADPQGDA